jgi:hypothetical protein
MYIGSIELTSQVMWTYDSELKRMVNREVKYVPGFFKIIDEILVNAADHKVKLYQVRRPRLTYGNTDQRPGDGCYQNHH